MEFSDEQISRAIEENNASRIRDYISLGLNVDRVLCNFEDPVPVAFTLLSYAIKEQAHDVVTELVDKKCKVDKAVKVKQVDGKYKVKVVVSEYCLECTSLYRAICTGNLDLVKLLIRAGSNVNMVDGSLCSTVWHAVDAGLYSITDVITVVPGCDINAPDKFRMAPLHVAIVHQNIKMVELLLARGVQIQQKQIHGATPLHLACGYTNTALVHLLLKHGCDPNTFDDEQITPLLKSLNVMNNRDTVYLLCNAGAKIYSKYLWRIRCGLGRLVLIDSNVRSFLLENLDIPTSLKVQCALAIKDSIRRRSMGKSICSKFERLPLPYVLIRFLKLDF